MSEYGAAQTDAKFRNNAQFTTPADGVAGILKLYMFDVNKPERDSALANDILVGLFFFFSPFAI